MPDLNDGFNPRPRVGGDRMTFSEQDSTCSFQSTPPRGRRLAFPTHTIQRACCFNPRPRVGGDVGLCAGLWSGRRFQSTPPRGRRPLWVQAFRLPIGFQSTPPRGRRLFLLGIRDWELQFQSTPPRGGRRCRWSGIHRSASVSIHAPAWGATSTAQARLGCPRCFNPRPRVGGDSSMLLSRLPPPFQSTPPRGGRRCSFSLRATDLPFQSTPPRGGRPPLHRRG